MNEPYWPEYLKEDWLQIHQDLSSLDGVPHIAAGVILSGLLANKEKDDDDWLEFGMSEDLFDEVEKSAARLGIIK